MDSIVFVTKSNNNFYKLEIAKTLLHFIEYDFTYFWEQCLDLGRTSRKLGSYSSTSFRAVKSLITKCHPYYEAQINSDFEHIALDCLIEYICHSEGIGLEELWTRCISPKNAYEKALFTRISEYKTNRAINQWANLMRIQEYARAKLSYIFDGDVTTKEMYNVRKGYFDLAFSVMAKELGFPSSELPSVKCYNASLMPNSAFMVSRVSKLILKKINPIIDEVEDLSYSRNVNRDCMRDQMSLDAFTFLRGLKRPDGMELEASRETFGNLGTEYYLPDCFKAIIDLEFDKMIDAGIFLQKCPKCEKYFFVDINYKGKFCNRVNATGKTCREQYEHEKYIEEEQPPLSNDLETRCQILYAALSNKVGDDFKEQEFKEWSQYLENMRENVKTDAATEEDLEAFLEYSEKMCKEVKSKPAARVIRSDNVEKMPPPVRKRESERPEPRAYHFPTLEELDRKYR
ncbi:MAG: hypothetical protein E7507_02795 [Ruminococcus sp.]|nr:hypothetical protein [Ruminococcus sp.]